MKLADYCKKTIEYSFYAIFFFVPLVFSQYTSELFELNKIWTLYFFTIIILGAWLTKMVLEKEVKIRRTFFDIPIALFLLSQLLSTVFSLDQHISFYGYYSRFNGGLLSTLTYIFLYYAFVSNFTLREVWRGLSVTLWTGVIVALWGFPSHFGYDPTCLLFRGTLDTSCWTEAFHPTVRIFSTLGQPAWLAAYLALLLPLAMYYMLRHDPDAENDEGNIYRYLLYAGITLLFFTDLIFANTRAGYLGFLFAYIAFWGLIWFRGVDKKKQIILSIMYVTANLALLFLTVKGAYSYAHLLVAGFMIGLVIMKRQFLRTFLIVNIAFLAIALLFNTPLGRPEEPLTKFFTTREPAQVAKVPAGEPAAGSVPDVNITDSGTIRRIVWKGAIDIWQAYPLFGSGVETYAFAYYKFRPAEHNLTSEWDYLYNKAHNEYLNYLATTGAFGLGTYLLFIGFTAFAVIQLLLYRYIRITKNAKNELDGALTESDYLAIAALTSGYISILITNFFGFSVVIINLYFFLIPAIILFLAGKFDDDRAFTFTVGKPGSSVNPYQWTYITFIFIFCLYLILNVYRTWNADKAYALGYNLNRVGDFQNAYMKLDEAVKLRPAEPLFKDEFAITNATIASALYEQQDATNAGQFAQQAISLSNEVTTNYPNNIIFIKDRFKVFYLLAASPSEFQKQYLQEAIISLKKALELAPTDAKLHYNLGVLHQENGSIDEAIRVFEKAISLKPDYYDAYFALGHAYRKAATNDNGVVINPDMQEKAVVTMQTIIEKFGKDSASAQEALEEWGVR